MINHENILSRKDNPTICVLTNSIRPIYKYEIITGIEEEASKNKTIPRRDLNTLD